MISSFLVAELDKDCQKTGNTIFAYYFFDNKVKSRRSALVLLRTLLLQFLEQRPSLFRLIAPDFKKLGQKLMEGFDALWRILVSMLQHLLQTNHVWILIDAVDECDEDRTPLLESLRDWITEAPLEKNAKLRVLLTYRPYADIQDLLSEVGQDLQIDRGTINADLEKFIDIRVDEIYKSRPNWNTQKIKDALKERSGGTFLWAALVLKVLMLPGKTLTMKQVLKRLEEMPTDLREIYDKILGDVDEEHVEDAVKVLQRVIAASRPLRVAELTEAHAFTMPDWPKTQAE